MRYKTIVLLFFVSVGIFLVPQTTLGETGKPDKKPTGSDREKNSTETDNELSRDELYEQLRSQDQSRKREIADPLEPINRKVFKFNDKVYVYVFNPVSDAYIVVVPVGLRDKIGNIFYNLGYPQRFVNDILQLRFNAAAKETGSFLINTCLGFLGYLDVAQHIESLNPPPPDNDAGLTLGYWGVGQGFYIVWPFMGPSTLRASVGMVGDYYIEYYTDPLTYYSSWKLSWALRVEERLNKLPSLLNRYENMKGAALSPYTAVKNGYIQYRKKKLRE